MHYCKHCNHSEDDHDGYAGLCDGLHTAARAVSLEQWELVMDARMMCGCVGFEEEEEEW